VRVAPGWHTFKWIYFKDMSKTCLPATACADSARIHSIGYNGTAWADTWCRDCPRGTASEPGASRCSNCLPDSVFDSRSFSCVPCPSGHYALPGFTGAPPWPCAPCPRADPLCGRDQIARSSARETDRVTPMIGVCWQNAVCELRARWRTLHHCLPPVRAESATNHTSGLFPRNVTIRWRAPCLYHRRKQGLRARFDPPKSSFAGCRRTPVKRQPPDQRVWRTSGVSQAAPETVMMVRVICARKGSIVLGMGWRAVSARAGLRRFELPSLPRWMPFRRASRQGEPLPQRNPR
jgi:hypothetical protein